MSKFIMTFTDKHEHNSMKEKHYTRCWISISISLVWDTGFALRNTWLLSAPISVAINSHKQHIHMGHTGSSAG